MKFKCGSVGQYKFYDVTISGFIKGAEHSFLLLSCAAVITFDYGLCECVCIRICAARCVPADECEVSCAVACIHRQMLSCECMILTGSICLYRCFHGGMVLCVLT